ncbi:hypothetical protein KSS87_010976 [Heliosperma pusillum]|nr:hypothetical protein KSS87_010976 [Heliosperma pusillum]
MVVIQEEKSPLDIINMNYVPSCTNSSASSFGDNFTSPNTQINQVPFKVDAHDSSLDSSHVAVNATSLPQYESDDNHPSSLSTPTNDHQPFLFSSFPEKCLFPFSFESLKAVKKSKGMADMAILLRIKIIRGINLAIRDFKSSDPYVILQHGTHKLKTRYVRKTLNPEWNEELTLSVMNPYDSVKLYVYDHDTFSLDDKMGDAEFDIKCFMEAIKMNLEGLPDGTVITKVKPERHNCISEESSIVWMKGKVTQTMFLRLRNVEKGEIQLQIEQMDAASPRGV